MWTAAMGISAASSSSDQTRIQRFYPANPSRRLHGQGGDASHSVASMGGYRLNVGRNAGSRRGVETADGQYDWWFFGHDPQKK
jgi:hypothetical protein